MEPSKLEKGNVKNCTFGPWADHFDQRAVGTLCRQKRCQEKRLPESL